MPSTTGTKGPVAVDRRVVVRDFGQVILFTNDADIVAAERHRVYNPDEDEEVGAKHGRNHHDVCHPSFGRQRFASPNCFA
jgi:hypothetical protein